MGKFNPNKLPWWGSHWSPGFSPSLDNNGQSRTVKRKKGRVYKGLMSFCTYLRGQGFQLLRLDLTSVFGLKENTLTENFKKLRRRIERVYGVSVQYYKIETNEGYGVLHTILAINHERAVWISQKWLSDEWEKISGAKIIYIARVRNSNADIKKISYYMMNQYLAYGQGEAIVRVSWSWWRSGLRLGKAFTEFYKECKKNNYGHMIMGLSKIGYNKFIPYQLLIRGWNHLLAYGYWEYENLIFFIKGKEIDFAYL